MRKSESRQSSVANQKASVAITGASNKVFLIEEIESININKLKEFDVNRINFGKYDINSDINASSDYRISLIKSLINKSIINFYS